MDPKRFENANSLWRDGHMEDAASEFHVMGEEADYSDEKAGLLINEHKCYAQIGKLDKANEINAPDSEPDRARQVRANDHRYRRSLRDNPTWQTRRGGVQVRESIADEFGGCTAIAGGSH